MSRSKKLSVSQHVEGIRTSLSLGEQGDDASRSNTSAGGFANRKYGTLLPPLAVALADAMARHTQPFAGLPFTMTTLRKETDRMRELTGGRDGVGSVLEEINAEVRGSAARLSDYVDLVLATIDSVLRNPAVDAASKEKLREAAQHALALLDARREAIYTATQTGRALQKETDAAEKARAEAEASKAESERLARENKVLRGDDPGRDISFQPVPSAPKTTRKRTSRSSRRTPR